MEKDINIIQKFKSYFNYKQKQKILKIRDKQNTKKAKENFYKQGISFATITILSFKQIPFRLWQINFALYKMYIANTCL
jgi:hypothetical protein